MSFGLRLWRFRSHVKNFLPVSFALPASICSLKLPLNIRHRSTTVKQEVVKDVTKTENEMSQLVFDKVNEQIQNKTHGRLFAVIHLHGLQFKITTEDIIVIRTHWPANPGDKIRLEKVLLVGSSDFTLIGRPILPKDQVSVYGTVIEKTLTTPIVNFKHKPRKNFMRLTFSKDELSFLRITDIVINGKVNEFCESDGLKNRIF